MAKRPGGLFVNRFEAATRGNYNKASYLFKQHNDSLFEDSATVPIALACYNRANPKYNSFQNAHNAQSSQSGSQGGTVLSMTVILKGMHLHVDDWESKIKAVYPINSPEFKALFPKGKSIFNTGSQQNRVNAVATLLISIGDDASLAAIKTTIQAFYDPMLISFNTKDVSKKATKTDIKATEKARISMCNIMEGNYGLLIDNFQDEPALASKYFDEAYMTNTLQMSFDLKVKELATKKAIKRTFVNPITQKFQIINKTDTILKAFLSPTKNGLVGPIFVIIPPLGTGIYNLSDMGNNATQKFLNVLNTDNKIKADITIKVL